MRLTEEYKKQWSFFKNNLCKIFITLLILIFVLIIGTHFVMLKAFKDNPEIVTAVQQYIGELFAGIDMEASGGNLALQLFANNARACVIIVSLGVVPFIFLPLLLYGTNGIVVGVVTAFSQAAAGTSIGFLIAALLPHGLFEFPALAYSAALGFYLCRETVRLILRKSDKKFGEAALDTIRGYVLVVLPLLVAAALMEALVTPYIAAMFL